jgi:hypothetical protein
VLGRYTAPPVPVQLVYPASRFLAAKIRAFVDFAGERLQDVLGRQPTISPRAPANGTAERRRPAAARRRARSR